MSLSSRLTTKLSNGAYGTVWNTDDPDIVVKSQELDYSKITSFVCEILFTLKHPCIVEILEYSFDGRFFYYSMRKGIPVEKAYNEGKVDLRKIATDIMSALCYLERHGLTHGDINPRNLIYQDGRVKLIDFGLARKCVKVRGELYVRGTFYSKWFRDPMWCSAFYNSNKSELYALGKTLWMISTKPEKNIYYFDHIQTIRGMNEDERNFVVELTRRRNLDEILTHPFLEEDRMYFGDVLSIPKMGGRLTNFPEVYLEYMKNHCTIDCAFLILHNCAKFDRVDELSFKCICILSDVVCNEHRFRDIYRNRVKSFPSLSLVVSEHGSNKYTDMEIGNCIVKILKSFDWRSTYDNLTTFEEKVCVLRYVLGYDKNLMMSSSGENEFHITFRKLLEAAQNYSDEISLSRSRRTIYEENILSIMKSEGTEITLRDSYEKYSSNIRRMIDCKKYDSEYLGYTLLHFPLYYDKFSPEEQRELLEYIDECDNT